MIREVGELRRNKLQKKCGHNYTSIRNTFLSPEIYFCQMPLRRKYLVLLIPETVISVTPNSFAKLRNGKNINIPKEITQNIQLNIIEQE